ncbi:hypothetical protein NCPPB940_12690 [Xanthomonas hortorum pv. taraxaci]|nr:hypothetical protein NCPPB940_12690 [Xanthomonas hortorum pv. taraxaci]CAD0315001.1 hypothetical protein NCPPB940_12690 [Xanthomonas hortorum pv. taraxaci]
MSIKTQPLHDGAVTILIMLKANSFDAMIADPPYASGGLHAAERAKPPSANKSKAASRNCIPTS